MALLSYPLISRFKVDRMTLASRIFPLPAPEQRLINALKRTNDKCSGQRVAYIGRQFESRWSFIRGSKVFLSPKVEKSNNHRKGFGISASCKCSVILGREVTGMNVRLMPGVSIILEIHQDMRNWVRRHGPLEQSH